MWPDITLNIMGLPSICVRVDVLSCKIQSSWFPLDIGVYANVHLVPIQFGVLTASDVFVCSTLPNTKRFPNKGVGRPYLSLSRIEKPHEDPEVAALTQAPLTAEVDASEGPDSTVMYIGLEGEDSL